MNPARIFISFFIFLFLFFIDLSPVLAQSNEPKPDVNTYAQQVMIGVASSMTCMIAGINAVDPTQKCLGIANGKVGPVDTNGGAIGAMGNLIGMTFNIPVHTGDYVGYLASNFGIAKPSYAQGIGFKSLAPITDIWVAFRNIVYLLFVLVFVIIGFAIMFRVKIDPRTVMTIENQIPRIIIGIILVTFSLAVAGFLIDLMWVFSYLVIEAFASIDPNVRRLVETFEGKNALEIANNIQLSNPPSGFIGLVSNSSGAVKDMVSNAFKGLSGFLLGDLIVTIGASVLLATTKLGTLVTAISGATGIAGKIVVGGIAGTLAAGVALLAGQEILGIIGGLIAFVVIFIAVLWALFRLWFTLIKAYIFILLDIVFAPFWIISGLIPGSKLSFTGWLRDMAGNLIAYPATLVMFLLAQVFITKFGATQTAGQFVPPLIGNPGQPNAVGGLIGLGMILLTPSVVDMMRKAFQAPDIDLSSIWKAVGVGMGVGGIPGSAMGFGYQFHMAGQVPVFNALLSRIGLAKKPPATP